MVNNCLLPSIYPLCLHEEEGLQHMLFSCPYSAMCQGSMLSLFKVGQSFMEQCWIDYFESTHKKGPHLLWTNLSEVQDKVMVWSNRMGIAKRNAAACCPPDKEFSAYSIRFFFYWTTFTFKVLWNCVFISKFVHQALICLFLCCITLMYFFIIELYILLVLYGHKDVTKGMSTQLLRILSAYPNLPRSLYLYLQYISFVF